MPQRSSTWPRTRVTIAVGASLGGVYLGLSMLRTDHWQPGSVGLALVVFVAGCWVHRMLHDLGHWLAVALLRLPYSRRRPRWWPLPKVAPVPGPELRDLRRRMVLYAAFGPWLNFVVAAGTLMAMVPAGVRSGAGSVLSAVTLAGMTVGLTSLVPLKVGGRESDGYAMLRWIFRPTRARTNLMRAHADREMAAAVVEVRSGSLDLAELEALVASPGRDPQLLVHATQQLLTKSLAAGPGAFAQAMNQLAGTARSAHVDRTTGGLIAAVVAHAVCTVYLKAAAYDGTHAGGPADIDELAALAELGHTRQRQSALARLALAMARILQGRPADAVTLLPSVGLDLRHEYERGSILAVRAIAELYLGDPERAAWLLRSAQEHHCPAYLRTLAHDLAAAAARDRLPAWPAAAASTH